ncbi:MAG TPA: hypothetical protein P5120_18595 [Spirochaetota bacterium]|nr:hypothetical protein [Spirochaetota bacterium]HPJ44153.1 hypothetical protein [Spirochaetota bacterium]HPR74465.1 hypothetical protein [Bacteroidales bacterium]HRX49539.1 hypothetical protein [Spirochaetota bacterium]
MKISVLDASSYLKGLLLLIRKDRKISEEEHELISRVGKNLGFEKKFVENAIHEILDNKYITVIPPEFSSQEIAEKFLKDGLVLAASDNEIHPAEEKWLLAVAERNNIDAAWFLKEKSTILCSNKQMEGLEAEKLQVNY